MIVASQRAACLPGIWDGVQAGALQDRDPLAGLPLKFGDAGQQRGRRRRGSVIKVWRVTAES